MPWGSVSALRLDHQLAPARGGIMLAPEPPLRQQTHHQFRRGAHQRSVGEMAADHLAPAVGYGDMQVGAIARKGSCERKDLQIAAEPAGLLLPRQPDAGHRKTADATDQAPSLFALLAHPVLQRQAQVFAWPQPQRDHLHGINSIGLFPPWCGGLVAGALRGVADQPAQHEQRCSPASTFKIPNALIGLSLGAVSGVDERIPYTGGPNPFMREWLEPMGLRGAIRVSNVPPYQELARRIGLRRMDEAVHRLGYGNEQIGSDVTTFWLRGPLAISAVEQTRFLSRLAHRKLPFPKTAQQQVAAITQVDTGPGWSLHAKTGWQNSPGAGVGWWVGWVQQGRRITPFALNIAMSGPADTPKREQLARASLQALGVLPRPGVLKGTTHK